MSGICGWIGDGPGMAAGERTLERMAQRLSALDGSRARVGARGPAALAVAALFEEPDHVSTDGLEVGIEGDAHWIGESPGTPLAPAIASAYRRHGEEVVGRLQGAFGLAIAHRDGSGGLLAADRLGIRPLYYAPCRGGVLFATTLDALLEHPAGPRALDPQGIYDYVYFSHVPAPRTCRRDCRRLMPGELLRFRDGRIEVERYWRPAFRTDGDARFGPLAEEFRGLLRDSVGRLAGGRTGAFLSGGTDSSTVSGLLGEVTGRPAPTFSIGFRAEGYDETEYARIASRHFGTDLHVSYVTPEDVVDSVPRIAAAYPDPFGNESVVPAYHCAKLAREHGIERLLAGDGGDELFAGNTRYAKQHVFARYGRLPGWLRRGLIEPLLSGFPAGDRIWPVRKACSYVRQANVPMPDRLGTYNLLERFGAERVFEPAFLVDVDRDGPRRLEREVYRSADASTLLDRMLAYDWKFTLADSDLVKVGRMCELAGVRVAYPLLSDDLVEFSTRVPASLKLKPFRLRWFFKRALRDFLPDEILRKSKHGFGLPFGVWLAREDGLRGLAEESLRGLRGRGIVRPDFLDEIDRVHRSGAAHYFGVMIWHFLMLEQWFRAHVDGARSDA